MGKYDDCIKEFNKFANSNLARLHNNLKNEIEIEYKINYDCFRKKFKICFGKSVKQYFSTLQLEVSKEQLLTTEQSILSIALSIGFLSESNFITWFKRKTKKYPTQYRNSNINTQ